MLFATLPLSIIDASISPPKDPLPMSFIIFEITFILLATVGPFQDAFTVHFVGTPFSSVDLIILPDISTLAIDLIIIELSFKYTPIRKFQYAFPFLLSI